MIKQPQAIPCPIPENGHHYEAYLNQLGIYADLLAALHSQKESIQMLDFGCGESGVSRVILEHTKSDDDPLMLFDPHCKIEPPLADNNVHIVTEEEVFQPQNGSCDLVNISYVLCLLEPEEAHSILTRLREAHPKALLSVIDYVLKGREEYLRLLTCGAEKKWREKLGEEAFERTHARFDIDSLSACVHDAGWNVLNGKASPIDNAGMRAALIAGHSPVPA